MSVQKISQYEVESPELTDEQRDALTIEFESYVDKTPMTPAEKKLLQKWVMSGHSVYERPESKYLCLNGVFPDPDFLDVYRMDREIGSAIKGKSKAEKIAYLKAYVGDTESLDVPAEEPAFDADKARETIQDLENKLFYLWMFISQEGLYEEANEFLNDHAGEVMPF